jgi:hypothetical protein
VEHSYLYNMARKKWTPQNDKSPSLIESREKRKWQIALRRYVFLQSPCTWYAPFFGLDALKLREWIASQFTEDMNWDNFSGQWYFGHVLSPAFFDFELEEDLKLCWNFLNISVTGKNPGSADHFELARARDYYLKMDLASGLSFCGGMLAKIAKAEAAASAQFENRIAFAQSNQEYIKKLYDLDAYQFEQLNSGVSLDDVISERELFNKF